MSLGPHQVLVLLDGVTVPGCPFSCNIYDVNKVNISGLNSCIVGKPMTFQGICKLKIINWTHLVNN